MNIVSIIKNRVLILTILLLMNSFIIGNVDACASSMHEDSQTIVFVGDSITAAYTDDSYVHNLTHMPYWNNLTAINSGRGGNSVGRYYRDESRVNSEISVYNPSFVVIFLGLADASWYNNETAFSIQYDWLIKDIMEQNPQAKLLIVKFSWAQTVSVKAQGSHVKIIEDIAIKYQLPYVNLYSYTKGKSEWFWDGVHPNSLGAYHIAKALNDSFVEYIQGKTDYPVEYPTEISKSSTITTLNTVSSHTTEKENPTYQTSIDRYSLISIFLLYSVRSKIKRKER